MVISVASRKAKGRRLQDWVRDQLYLRFPSLEEGDIRGAIMGETGADIKLSPLAAKQIPIKIECKSRESYKGIYASYQQATKHEGKGEPILVIKMNRENPLVIVDASYFLDFIKKETPCNTKM
jgi:hypothetical protein